MNDPKSISSTTAMVKWKCPRCRQGNIFKTSVWSPLNFTATYEHCPHCGLRYSREPSFFDGAMYISYAFSVAIVTTVGVATYVLGRDPEVWVYLLAVAIALIFMSRFSFRYSRTLMLHFFGGVAYEPDKKDQRENIQ